jgi:energy-coupling factor transporter ATP-binding protein EcfA2
MTTIEEAIVEWNRTKPVWLQVLLREVAVKGVASEEFLCEVADAMVVGALAAPPPLMVTDLPTGSGTPDRVQLGSIGELENVNALLGGETLTFGKCGLTVVYGDNASGKSGYARLVKEVAEARHRERVRPNAYVAGASKQPQRATIHYTVGNDERKLVWPDLADASTRSIHFHDEACGDQYLQSDSELTYQPSALQIFPWVIAATDALRRLLDERLKALTLEPLPTLTAGTASATFLAGIGRQTTAEQIEVACILPDGADERHAALVQELARLDATDPGKEKARLSKAAMAATQLAQHFDLIQAQLGEVVATSLTSLGAEAMRLREAAELASKISFADEPLDGVGTEAWRALWAAAEAYSGQQAYVNAAFPVTDASARCVLCQQELSQEAGQRLARFHAFVHNKTESNAVAAEQQYRQVVQRIRDVVISSATTSQALTTFKSEDETLTQDLSGALKVAEMRKAYLLSLVDGEDQEQEPTQLNAVDTTKLRAAAQVLSTRAAAVDDSEFKRTRDETKKQRDDLAARIDLAKGKDALARHVATLAKRAQLQEIKDSVGTGQITSKATELTRKYAAQHVSTHFVRECERLGVDKVFLGDAGGSKGKLRQKPELLGALGCEAPSDVLSEGEKTALGLAGLFTEVHFDSSKSALVLDDPVSSLSHARRKLVAKRVVEIAENRQVIVFTHDLTFLGYLISTAKNNQVLITERCIERACSGDPGHIVDQHPWKARDPNQRFGNLDTDLARIGREKQGWNQEQYRREVGAWAGDLSETYERIIRSYVAFALTDRATTEVQPRMFRMVARITADDNQDFQDGYSTVTEWASRHDKSEEVNYTPPSTAQMKSELERARAWFNRIKSYHN